MNNNKKYETQLSSREDKMGVLRGIAEDFTCFAELHFSKT